MSKELKTTDTDKLIAVLQTSLYVGAKPESVMMVLDYCKSAGLDPMQKPVHIVPMSVKNPVSGAYEWRDIVMPGVGLYRIQADRSGTMAGISEPEFGPPVEQVFTDKNGKKVNGSYPEWCKITVKKIVGDHIVEFVAKEYWIENYATDSKNSDAPNAMWRKRPRGQIAKCAEAQALRKAWPEIGSAPTAEEMEGKVIDMGAAERIDDQPRESKRTELPEYPDDKFQANAPTWQTSIASGKKSPADVLSMIGSKYKLSDDQIKVINAMAQPAQTDDEFIAEYNKASEANNANS